MKYARRVDDNHAEIKSALIGIGCYVIDCSGVGSGFPDLIVGFRGHWTLIEIKDGRKPPSRRRLTGDQQVFHAEAQRAGCRVWVVENVEQALAIFGAKRAA